jgi:hypothetical protein
MPELVILLALKVSMKYSIAKLQLEAVVLNFATLQMVKKSKYNNPLK